MTQYPTSEAIKRLKKTLEDDRELSNIISKYLRDSYNAQRQINTDLIAKYGYIS